MLQRRMLGRPIKIGVGANRAATAASFIEIYGYLDPCRTFSDNPCVDFKEPNCLCSEKIGAAVLDDGMQVIMFLKSQPFRGCNPCGLLLLYYFLFEICFHFLLFIDLLYF